MRAHDDIDMPLLAVIGIVSGLLLLEAVVAAQAYFYNAQENEFIAKQVSQPSWELQELTNAQQADLHSYRWTDREKQRVAIDIDQAIGRLVAREAQAAATRPARGSAGGPSTAPAGAPQ